MPTRQRYQTRGGGGDSVRQTFVTRLSKIAALSAKLCLVCLAVVLLAGWGSRELEDAKQQINSLTAENKKSTELSATLNNEKSRLDEELKTVADMNSGMRREQEDLNKAKAALSDENKKLKEKNSAIDEEIASLKREKARQAQEVEEFKKHLAELARPAKSPAAIPTEIGPGAKSKEELSPCDAVIAFMKTSEGIIKQQKGKDGKNSLEQIKKQYAPRMKGAPAKAIKAAEDWVKEGTKLWDHAPRLIIPERNRLLGVVQDACGKSPDSKRLRVFFSPKVKLR
jgi:DNA repair exonuclease SbcCD ATPase subunit